MRVAGRRQALIAAWVFTALVGTALSNLLPAQRMALSGSRLSSAIYLPEIDSATRAHLERAKAFRDAGQWSEVDETLREVMDYHGHRLIEFSPGHWVDARTYCHVLISQLPAEALALYRSQVDPLAEVWYREGVARRDRQLLSRLVDEHFASSFTDQALFALSELALEAGDHGLARSYLEMLVPTPPGLPETQAARLAYPDSDVELAAVGARIVLSWVLAGELDRAARDLEKFVRQPAPDEPPSAGGHPDASGRLAGVEGNYAQTLAALIESGRSWTPAPPQLAWNTFAGTATRAGVGPPAAQGFVWSWEQSLTEFRAPTSGVAQMAGYRQSRVAEDSLLLSYHPVVYRDVLLVNNHSEVLALNRRTGQLAWNWDLENGAAARRDERAVAAANIPANRLGAPRFTMTVAHDRLYVRMGSVVTSPSGDPTMQSPRGYLLCLDLRGQGRAVWEIKPQDPLWAFEGSPLVRGNDLFVAVRHNDLQHPRAHVECYDARTGRLRWRQFVCGADTPGRNQVSEVTHHLLTLHGDTVYFNTNLGAVAALAASDGRLRWVHQYERAGRGLSQQAAHFYRDLTPAIYHGGKLVVAPSDSDAVFCLDATSRRFPWENRLAPDVIHLLGVGGGHLIASGDRLYWFRMADDGKLFARWPDGDDPRGYGRGVLAGNNVLWPTREAIEIFDQVTAQWINEIPLADHRRAMDGSDVTGGNLLVVDDQLFIAGAKKLVALRGTSAPQRGESLTLRDLSRASR